MIDTRAVVNVPVSYVFRPTPADWTLAQVRVVAWSAIYQNELRAQGEAKKRAAGLRVSSLFDNSVISNDLRIEIKDPRASVASFTEVERNFVPAKLLPLAATPKNSPQIESEFFPVLVDSRLPLPEEDDHLGFLSNLLPTATELPPTTTNLDQFPVYPERSPWRMRKEFFSLKENDDNALWDFLRKWGAWGFDDSFRAQRLSPHRLYRPQDLWNFRNMLRSRSILSAKKWLEVASPLPALSSADLPLYTLTRANIRTALEDTITLEKMKQTEHAICARKGCGNIIAKTGKRPKKFCDESCALKVRQQRFWSARRGAHA